MTIIESLKDINSISYYIKHNSVDSIIFEMVARFNLDINNLIKLPMGGYNEDGSSGTYFYCIKDLKENIDEYIELYNILSDVKSKHTLLNIMRYRLTTDRFFIKDCYAGIENQYFDDEIINCNEDEVFVDCGAYIGDTIEKYISKYNHFKMIYGYEPDDKNYNKLISSIDIKNNIKVKNLGLGIKSSKEYYRSSDGASRVSKIPTDTCINVVSLDDDIDEDITFVKMDIEGQEIKAILGAKNHIKNSSPKLAISLYHIVSDIHKIPKLIMSINDNYKFYIRQYREDVAWETVLYCIPN